MRMCCAKSGRAVARRAIWVWSEAGQCSESISMTHEGLRKTPSRFDDMQVWSEGIRSSLRGF